MIYLDNAATTALHPEVLTAMMQYMQDNYANPSSVYKSAGQAKMAVDKARAQVAGAIGAKASELYFTGSGTEAINWAIKGIAFNNSPNSHIITSSVEHPAALHTMQSLEKHGFEVTYLPVDEYGMVKASDVADAIKDNTILVSVMFANNEVGTIMPIAEIGACVAQANTQREPERQICFFTDAVQALGQLSIDVAAISVDLLAISAHKINGPKGVGALYIKSGTKIMPLINGGGQERGRRGGTENVAGIVGMGLACELAIADMPKKAKAHIKMRDWLIEQITDKISHCKVNGHRAARLPNNVNIAFEFIEGEGILLLLDSKGICASSGSACTSGSLDPSHVLLSMGLSHELAHGSLRISFGRDTQMDELEKLVEVLPGIIDKLRQMSPLWEG